MDKKPPWGKYKREKDTNKYGGSASGGSSSDSGCGRVATVAILVMVGLTVVMEMMWCW